jgi:NADPH:quinone reductase-like Zn-dependent oxidoreductase
MIKNVRGLLLHAPGKVELCKNLENLFDFTMKPDQVLIQVKYAPINPSDFYYMMDMYHDKKPKPSTMGFEGYGIITHSGSPDHDHLIGKPAVFSGFGSPTGTFSSHTICNVKNLMVLDKEQDPQTTEFAANPLTAIGLLEKAKEHGATAFVQNGASSTMGKLLIYLGKKLGLESISIVRNEKHFEELTSLGGTEVICSTSPGYMKKLSDAIKKHHPTVAFDCLGGKPTGELFRSMPNGSIHYIYGAFELAPCDGISPADFIFKNKEIKGFHLFHTYLKGKSEITQYAKQVNEILNEFKQKQGAKVFELEDYEEAFKYYPVKTGKVLFKCSE